MYNEGLHFTGEMLGENVIILRYERANEHYLSVFKYQITALFTKALASVFIF